MMRFLVISRFSEKVQGLSELTSVGSIGTGPDMALGAAPASLKKKKLRPQKMPGGRIVKVRV